MQKDLLKAAKILEIGGIVIFQPTALLASDAGSITKAPLTDCF